MVTRVHQATIINRAGRSNRPNLRRGVDDRPLYGQTARRWTRLLRWFDNVLLVLRRIRPGLRLLLVLLLLLLLHLLLQVATATRWRSCHKMRLLLLLLLLLLLQTRMRTSRRWCRRIARCFGADRRRHGSSTVTWCLRGIDLQRFILQHKRPTHSVRTVATTTSVSLRRRIVVMRPAVMAVMMPSTNHAMTNDSHVMTTPADVMVLGATSGAPTRGGARPLVATVRIVKKRVLVRLRIRVKVVVDLGLELVSDGRRRCRRRRS